VRWSDVDFHSRQIKIRNSSKGGVPRYPYRTVPIPNRLYTVLMENKGKPQELLFRYHQNWRRDLLSDAKKAEVEEATLYKYRHTFASWLAQGGISLHQLRDLMGHTSVTTTEIYAHLLPNQHSEVLKVFN